MYQLNSPLYSSVFVIPSVIVEKYIKMASFCAIKSLLWILKNQSGNFSIAEIAKAVGSSEVDTKEAIDYWINEGVIIDSQANVSPAPLLSDTQYKKQEKAVPDITADTNNDIKINAPEIKIVRPTMEQIVNRINEDKQIKGLFNQAQEMLGRSIGFDMQSSLLMMYDTYGLDFDIILTLLQFCVDQCKTSNAYIISVAKAWYEKEITTLEKAHEYINERNIADNIFNEFKQFTGITAPKVTPKQAELFVQWNQLGFSTEMMVCAYNEAVDRTGKISWAYMNKILLNWNQSGYKTLKDVENGKETYKTNQAANKSETRSYDLNKAVNEAAYEPIKYKKKEKRSQV